MSLKHSSDQLIQIKCSYLIDKYKKKLKKLKDFKNELKLSFEKKNKAYYVNRYLLNKEKEELYKEFNKKKELEMESLERKKDLYNSYFADIFLYEQEYYQCIYKVFKNLLLKKEEIDEKEKYVIKLHEYAHMMFSDKNVNSPLEQYNCEKKTNYKEEYNNKKNIDIDNLCNININEIYESIIHDNLDEDMYTYNYVCKSGKENYPNEHFLKIDKVIPPFNKCVDSLNEICDNSFKNYEKNIVKKEDTNMNNDYNENECVYKEQGKNEKEIGEEKELQIEVEIEKDEKECVFEKKNSYENEQPEATEKEEKKDEIKDMFFEDKEHSINNYVNIGVSYTKKNEEKKSEGNYNETEDINKYIKINDDNKKEHENSYELTNEIKKKEYLNQTKIEEENNFLNYATSNNNYEYIKNRKEDEDILYTDEIIENDSTTFDSNNLTNKINKEIEISNIYTKEKDDNGENEKIENEELDDVIENNIIFNISSYFSGNYEEINDNGKEDKIFEENNMLNNSNFDESSKIKIEYNILKEDTLYKNDNIRNNSTENVELNSSNKDVTNIFLKEYSINNDEYKYMNSLSENKEIELTEFQKYNNYKNENSIKIEKINTFEDYEEEKSKIVDIENNDNFMSIENKTEKKNNSFKNKIKKKTEIKNIQELINYMSHNIKKSNNT
ncbi:conserved Plasmodium protein, unknown function [Plasmodium gallinaceum]|uniref:Uncharacterized protein n=1 Tax=Plasmodium gallinaceum TaxID=5849 RepID=A0A1J1GTX9_PLAGA|nr:conserved Plasmodium protein, unknown function [Plasmodium gallinaceum]CRG95938.1 conserved Plasmodium protein, unknown function [Plasmodium gallinaceum]